MDRFGYCTPKDQSVRHAKGVQTAPIYDDGSGWGNQASRDVTGFFRIVRNVLTEAYGDGLGLSFSYHDFGEQSFNKRHPHVDFTVNGYRILDGQAVPLVEPVLTSAEYLRLQDCIMQGALDIWGVGNHGNLQLKHIYDGIGPLNASLNYQMRTLVDFRKAEYNADRQLVAWHNYDTNGWEYMDVLTVLAGIAEMESRLGTWTQGDRASLHRAYGHMSDRLFKDKTAPLIGGSALPHLHGCTCSSCGDWERCILEDVDREVGLAKPLDWGEPPVRVRPNVGFTLWNE